MKKKKEKKRFFQRKLFIPTNPIQTGYTSAVLMTENKS